VEENSEEKDLEIQGILEMNFHMEGETMGDSERRLRGLSQQTLPSTQ
jgi:hypothetical protein